VKISAIASWQSAAYDRVGRAKILVRVERLIAGNPRSHEWYGLAK
jgi:hypothetical protein